MNINDLILNVKKKLESNIMIEDLLIEDKSFIHKNHKNNDQGKFHLKLTIKSKELKTKDKIERTKEIYNILDHEMKNYIHSLQISIS